MLDLLVLEFLDDLAGGGLLDVDLVLLLAFRGNLASLHDIP